MTDPAELLAAAWAPLLAFADGIDEDQGWTPTHLPGWTARDLLLHLAGDAQRALLTLFTPAEAGTALPETDEVDYWRAWQPGTDGAQTGLRTTRTIASQWSSVRGPAELFADTARAALRAARAADRDARVVTQGRTLTVDALLTTLAVEAAIHHLDLAPVLPDPPEQVVLDEVRRVLDSLLGSAVPQSWNDIRWIRVATGRATPDADETRFLGDRVELLPLFG